MVQIEFTPNTRGEMAHGEAASPRRRTLAGSIDAVLGTLVEIPAAILVVAEIVILFAGVVSRYVMHSPLIWSDELASILFLWLAMFGAVVAFRRAEHMRMTAVVAAASPAMRAFLDVVATCAALAFLLLVIWPAYDYAYEESFITTPALQIPNTWRAAALPVGIALMAVFALLRLVRSGDIRVTLAAIVSVAAVIGIFYLAQPWLRPLGNLNLIIFFVGVAGFCVFAGVPIAFGFGLAVFGYLALTTHTPLMVLVGRMDEGMSHLILLAVPLFVFLGLLIEMTGMARAMVAFLGESAGPCPRRAALRAARRDVPGVGHFGLEGRRHGGGRAGAVSGNEGARRQGRRSGGAAGRHRRADRNHSAKPRADHHRLGHRRFDLGAVHRRSAARRGAGDHAVGAGVVALSRRGSQPRQARRRGASRSKPSSSPCPRWRCRS